MTDYSELVKALRSASTVSTAFGKLMADAADAIEALQAEVERLTTEKKELAADRPEMVEADGHWEWRKPNGEVLMPKRGEWVELGYQPNVHETRYTCSLCGRQVLILSGSGELLKTYPYCHCGAKMEVRDGK